MTIAPVMDLNDELDLRERQHALITVKPEDNGPDSDGEHAVNNDDVLNEDDPVDEATIEASAAPTTIPVVDVTVPSGKSSVGLAVVMLLIAVVSSVTDQQLLKDIFRPEFNAPFFILYVGNIVRALADLPIYVLAVWTVAQARGPRRSVGKILSDTSIFKSEDPLPIYVIKSIGLLTSFIVLIMSLAIMAISYATVSECVAVGTTQVAMIYIIAVVFLHHQALIVKAFAVFVSLSGVGLIAYAKGVHSSSTVGIGLMLVSTVLLSFTMNYYKILYKRMSFGQCCCFLSASSLFMLTVFWWLPLWTKLTEVEVWEWQTVPWTLLLSSLTCSWISSMCMNYGLGLATPLLMSFGSLLRIPVNVGIDVWIRHVEFTELEMAGSALIVIGFLIIVIPDNKVSIKLKSHFVRSPK